MGCPAVLLFPVRGKLQSLQTSVLIGPYSVSWKPSRCRLIGLSFRCEDFAANWCLPGWVPLPLPTSCCSQSAYSAARVCVRVFVRVCVCGHPFLPLPSFSSTKQPAHPPFHSHPPFPHLLIHCVFLSHTHTLLNKHSHTPATWGPAAAWCVWVTGESYIGACMCVCVCFQCSSVSAADFCFTWDRAQQDKERGDIEVYRSWIRDFAQGNDSLISCKNAV